MKSFSNETLCFSSESSAFPKFWILLYCTNSASRVQRIHQNICNKIILSTGEPDTCQCVILLHLIHRVTFSIHWYIAQNLQPTFSMLVLFRRLIRTAIFSTFYKVAMTRSNFMNQFYDGGFTPEIKVSMLKETVTLVRDYVSELRK